MSFCKFLFLHIVRKLVNSSSQRKDLLAKMSVRGDEVIELLEKIDVTSFVSDEQRGRAAVAVKDLLARVQTPWEQIYQLTWMEVIYLFYSV